MAKATQGAQGAQAVAAPVLLQVKGNVPLRGARAAWYAVLLQYNGKPVSAFVAAVTAKPPSTPQRGKLAGKPEPVAGWLNWFVRQGIASYTNTPQA